MSRDSDYSRLVDGYCSGSLTDEEFAHLEEGLRKDPELRRDLLESRMLESELRQFALSIDQQGTASKIIKIHPSVWVGASAAAAALVALLAGYGWKKAPEASAPEIAQAPGVQLDLGVAVLAREHGARWSEMTPRPGDSMPPGRWNLTAGMAEIQFYSGASVTLQAPAELEILSVDGGILHRGRLSADVPLHARGFTIKTDTVELVDLGTSFGISIGDDSRTEIHVFEGEVELFSSDTQPDVDQGRLLSANEARVFQSTGEESPLECDPSLFDGATKLDEFSENDYSRWKESFALWEKDPRLLAGYNFESAGASRRSLKASSSILDLATLEGTIIGARWGEGRWPQKKALDFKRPSDRLRIDVPGKYGSITMVASLRIDAVDNFYNSILLSDGWDRPGAWHWQILRNKQIALSVSGGGEQTQDHQSRAPFILEPSDLGRWTQFAVTYDTDRGKVMHYQDGFPLGEASLTHKIPAEIRLAEIGNWTPPHDQAREIRNFNGRIDEVLIFREALSAEEIANFYTGRAIRTFGDLPSDRITSFEAPERVTPGETVIVPVTYSSAEPRTIRLSFTLDTPPWTNFGAKIIDVPGGAGTVAIAIPINPNTPIARSAYKFQASIVPLGADFKERFDSITRQGVDSVKAGR